MAKKRGGGGSGGGGSGSGGGSNIGLIITLVFFVLLSVILSVLTYMGFSEQAELNKKLNEAVAKEKAADGRRDWYRFQANVYRQYMGHPVTDKEALAQLKNQKVQYDGGTLPFAPKEGEGGADGAEVKRVIAQLNTTMPWDANASDEPARTYESRLKDMNTQVAALVDQAEKAVKEKTDALDAQKKAENDAKEAETARDRLAKSNTEAKNDAQNTSNTVVAAVNRNLEAAAERDEARKETAKARTERDRAEKQRAKLESDLAQARRDLQDVREEKDGLSDRLKAASEEVGSLREKVSSSGSSVSGGGASPTAATASASSGGSGQSSTSPRAYESEAAVLDIKALQLLKTWNRPWRIAELDRTGKQPYINLGTSDGLTSQVTFSVHSTTADGQLNPKPKATVEVVRVIAGKMSQVRVTSLRDPINDPILKGDRLFNPTWDPNRKKHVAIAGMADLGGDGENNQDLLRLLNRQKVVVDAIIDTRDDKDPKLVGRGVTVNTDYLLLGDGLEGVNHPKARDKEYVRKFDDLIKKLKEQAKTNGVTVLTLRRYLDMVGYRAPRAVTGR